MFGNDTNCEFHYHDPIGKYSRLDKGEDGAELRHSSQMPSSADDTRDDDNMDDHNDAETIADQPMDECETQPQPRNDGSMELVPPDPISAADVPDDTNGTADTQGAPWKQRKLNDDWVDASLPDNLFSDQPEGNSDIEQYEGVSACPAGPPNCKIRRTALHSKTSPGEALARGHLDAMTMTDAAPAAAQSDSGDFDLERELENIMELDNDEPRTTSDSEDDFDLERELEISMEDERTPENHNITNPPAEIQNTHGGYLLQTNDIIWCFHCGGSATLGQTSRYLRKACTGKPANLSMTRRRKRLINHQHPTTSGKLSGTHKRVRIS